LRFRVESAGGKVTHIVAKAYVSRLPPVVQLVAFVAAVAVSLVMITWHRRRRRKR
jgi:hypothetical protein